MLNLLFIVLVLSLPLTAKTLVKLNGSPISEEEVLALFPDLKAEDALDRYLLYRLAITKAEKDGLNQTDAFKKKMDKLLYNEFLLSELSKNQQGISPTEEEVKSEYLKYPLYRVFHLVLKGEPTSEENKKKLAEIKKQLERNVRFEKLIVKYSEDPSGAFRGDLNYKGVHNLSKEMYTTLQNTAKNIVSAPLYLDRATHLLLWSDQKTYLDAPISYITHLKNTLQKQKETTLLRARLDGLLKTAKVEKEEGSH